TGDVGRWCAGGGDGQHRKVLEIVGVVRAAVTLRIIGGGAIIPGINEAIGQIDAELRGRAITTAILKDRIAFDSVGNIRLPRNRDGITKDGYSPGAVKFDQVSGACGRPTDDVE